MIFNSEFNLENLPRQNFNFCGAIMFNDENEEFYPEMDLGAICKSIRIKTLYFVSLTLIFIHTDDYLHAQMLACSMTRCTRDMVPRISRKTLSSHFYSVA